ncbi:putative iron-sulfur cluster-binding metallochaperone [Cohnella algarum]|uniref:putative iron-sulfur cluster-binding metallochaperone n=1 Tax=Cohnella algarum TaxID=2044859 RepID=UPI0019688694|nr:(2Fe-2S)-binding protein [Cohnella algarum]MBN2981826.1 (2Fe-2S)-binding protein [Cohnella algarum]
MDCCAPSNYTEEVRTNCPSCKNKGKNVQLITLKSLLKASALETIVPDTSYFFCPNSSCSTVYFSGDHLQSFTEDNMKVPVYQKNLGMDVPVCYCFNWTRERLLQAATTDQQPADRIKAHVQAGRCGCEVNNPQGVCCLGNVNAFVRGLNEV